MRSKTMEGLVGARTNMDMANFREKLKNIRKRQKKA